MISAAILARVPGADLQVSPLPGGRNNRLYRIDSTAGSFALRVRATPADPPGVDRIREALVQAAAAAAGLAPRLFACATQDGWLLMDFVDGESWAPAHFAEAGKLRRLGERLAQLHGLPCAAGAVFDAVAIARRQIARIRKADPNGRDLTPMLTALEELELQLDALRRPVVMNHGDLDAAN
ncbi:MAG: phosphotransferase, partial [Steroidobacteraceae bacterium]